MFCRCLQLHHRRCTRTSIAIPPPPGTTKFPDAYPLALHLLERMLAFESKNPPTFEEVEREPSAQPVTKMEFEFERIRITKEDRVPLDKHVLHHLLLSTPHVPQIYFRKLTLWLELGTLKLLDEASIFQDATEYLQEVLQKINALYHELKAALVKPIIDTEKQLSVWRLVPSGNERKKRRSSGRRMDSCYTCNC
nr:mitogen-activated protein kinase 16 [Tanacetum cinerariifolium]